MVSSNKLNQTEQEQLTASESRVWKTVLNVITIVIVLGGLALLGWLPGGIAQSSIFVCWVILIILWSAVRRYWLKRIEIRLNDKYQSDNE